ncbi:MAG: TonB-dependent receptor [Balneolaceae bacterium]
MRYKNTIRHILCYLLFGGVIGLGAADSLSAQSQSVSGTVTSVADGEALPGVNIAVKGTTMGTTSDFNGEYSLTVPSSSDTLVFSFIGYETLEVPVEGRSVIDIALVQVAIEGGELVVIGYGAVQRRDITGSVASVSSQDIQEVPVSDAGQALQGRATGVVALSSGNRPGQGMTIRIRGRRSLSASNEPLFVVDGIPLEGNINDINPRDIESMEVLKDASATAIYGSRGANGVVLVTTSRGGNHPTTVSYSGHTGISQVLGTPDMMSGPEFAEMKEISGRSFTAAEMDAIQRGVSTDWIDLLLEEGYQHNHQLTIQGGNENTQFSVSGNFFFERGVISNQDFNRNTFRVNLDHSISDRFRIGTSTQISNQVQNWGSNPYGGALATNPLAEPYDSEGNLIYRPGADPLIFNPLADLEDDVYVDERTRLRVFSNIFADLQITDNFNYRMNFGPDFQDYRRGLFQGSLSGARQFGSPYAAKEHSRNMTYTFENILTFREDFGEHHAIDVTGLYSIQKSTLEESDISASELPYEHQKFHNIGTGATIEGLGSNLEEWGLMSWMGRVNYRLMDRYLLTVTGRYDGSSRLAEENRWGFFPSAAIGWRISDEPFMADQTLFSELRARVSYGVTGNTAINPYQTRGGLNRTNYSFGGNSAYGYRPGSIANPELKWETSATFNIGIDFGLWNDRVAGSVEVYQTKTTDLLLQRNIPITSGFNSVLENIGETQNRGYEVNITSRNISNQNFSWTTTANIFGNSEEIVDLYGTGTDDIGNEWFIGEALTVWYDYDKTGIWQLNEADQAAEFSQTPGQIKVRDVNGDGRINEQDRVIIGTDMPLVNIGLGNRFRYKDFDLSVFVFGSFGHTIFNNFQVANSTMQGRYNNLSIDYWTPDNPTNNHPVPDGSLERPLYDSSRGYMPGDFLKVRNIQFGYNLPVSLLGQAGIRSARIYLNAETPFVFSRLDEGVDPEQYGGRIEGSVPSTRLFTVGVNINF